MSPFSFVSFFTRAREGIISERRARARERKRERERERERERDKETREREKAGEICSVFVLFCYFHVFLSSFSLRIPPTRVAPLDDLLQNFFIPRLLRQNVPPILQDP